MTQPEGKQAREIEPARLHIIDPQAAAIIQEAMDAYGRPAPELEDLESACRRWTQLTQPTLQRENS